MRKTVAHAICLLASVLPASAVKPNIIYIMTDQQSANAISCAGMQENETTLPDSLRNRTLGNLMARAGYNDAYCGKWHVNTNSLPTMATARVRISGIRKPRNAF